MNAENDELAEAFADLRARAALSFAVPDTAEVYSEVRQRKARKLRFSAMAALLAASGLLAASMLGQEGPTAPPAERQQPMGSAHAEDPPTPSPSATFPTPASRSATVNAPRRDLANEVRFLTEPKIAQLRDSTIVLPSWPTTSPGCPAGTFTFADGTVPTGAGDPIGRPLNYLLLFRASLGIYANLDGVAGDEMVVPLACGLTEVDYQLLVLKDSKDGLHALGYIPGLAAFDRFYPYGSGLVVEVLDDSHSTVAEQRRRYGWNGSRFVQTHGPVSFPADLSPDVRQIDLRQSYLRIEQCGGGMLSFLDGVSGTWRFADRDFPGGDTHPATNFELAEISTGLLHEPAEFAEQGDALVTVACKPEGGSPTVWVVKVSAAKAIAVLKVGQDGVTRVVSHRIIDGLAEVTVQTQAGQRIWRYTSNGQTLTRIP